MHRGRGVRGAARCCASSRPLSPNPNPNPNPIPTQVLRVQSDGASCVVLMAQPCHHSICPSARAARLKKSRARVRVRAKARATLTLPLPLPLPLPRYNSTTCPEQRAVRLENVRQGLGEGQWMQRHDGRVLLRMNSTAAQEGEP